MGVVAGEIPTPRTRDPRMNHTPLGPLHVQANEKGRQLSSKETGQVLTGLIELADRMRRSGGGSRELLHWALDEQIAQNTITMDEHAALYRHMAIHAAVVKPLNLERFHVCPVCEAYLDVPEGPAAA